MKTIKTLVVDYKCAYVALAVPMFQLKVRPFWPDSSTIQYDPTFFWVWINPDLLLTVASFFFTEKVKKKNDLANFA